MFLVIGIVVGFILIAILATRMVVSKPEGKTLEERFNYVCRMAHYTPEYEEPRFVSRLTCVALSSNHIIHYYIANGNSGRNVYDIQHITGIDSQRGFEKGEGGVPWGTLFVHMDDGREGRIRIPADEIDTFIAAYKQAMEDSAEFWKGYHEALEDQKEKMNGGQ